MMMMMVKNIRTSITSRLLVVLLQVHQKLPPPQLHNSRIILSTSVAVVPSIFGPKFAAALLPGIYKKTRGTGGGLGVPPPPVSSHLTHLSASSPKRNCRLLALLTQSRFSFDRRNKNTKESAGDKQNQFYSTDFVDLLVDHHHNHHRQGHILDYQPVTFRCVANFTTSNRTWLNTSNNLWSFRTLLKAPTTCPIRTFSLSSVFNSKNMSHDDSGLPGNVDGNIQDMRKPYRHGSDTFDIKDLSSRDPMTQFGIWFNEAKNHPDIKEPNAIALATASRTGQPSVRMVLLKGFCKEGFKFFTNYDSRKGQELLENPLCSVCLHWEPLNRSVRIDGKVVRLSEEESTRYFQCRPRPSQLGAAVSDQSIVIPSREYLMNKYEELEKKYGNEEIIPKPDFWGGYLIEPFTIEFWQGQTTRVHDRLRFRKKQPDEVLDPELTHEGENGWVIERLSP